MILDPVFIAAEAIARVQHRRMFVGNFRQFVEFSAREFTEAIVMRLHLRAQLRIHVELEEILQSAIDAIEVHSAAIEREMIGSARWLGDFCFHVRPRAQV
jgi:hypothetical protein